jgi:DNA sulfur modification protein DndD
MIITKIELTDFMCYAGYNAFEFKEGLNVIIGDNGYGKSKLFDAFHWVLYNEIFIPELKEFRKTSTKEVGANIIADKAKFESVDGTVKTSVKITFHNIEKDSIYIWERDYSAKLNGDIWTGDRDSVETIWQKDLSYLNAKIVELEFDRKKIREMILPNDIKKYMWFQGEQVESMIDFNDSKTLTTAINILSNISRFDNYIETTNYLRSASDKEYTKLLKESGKDKKKSEELEAEKIKLEEEIERLEAENKQLTENILKSDADCNDLLNKISEAEKIGKLQSKREVINKQFDEIDQDYAKAEIGFHKNMFKEFWILKGTEGFIDKYGKKYEQYSNKHYEIINDFKEAHEQENETLKKLQTRLPFNVPEDLYLEKMLEHQRCLVCDRDALKESEPWLKIKELLDRKVDVLKVENQKPFKIDLENEFKELHHNAIALQFKIRNTDESINESLQFREDYKNKRDKINNELKEIDDEIEKILIDSSIKSGEEARHIINEFKQKSDDSQDFKIKKERNTSLHEKKKIRIAEIMNELSKNSKNEIPEGLSEKVTILKDLNEIAISTRKRIYNQLIEKLEKEMNIHYKSMTSGLSSFRGNIKLIESTDNNFIPQIRNSEGIQDSLLNTSNLMLIKLATIMSIITAKKATRSTDLYTLITDAPLSTFGDNYIMGFCKTVSKVYRQSIVMSKEFYQNVSLRNQLLVDNEINIGKVYILTPSLKESERESRNNLHTEIQPLN